jgi:class 3 adenylate cyclase
MRILANLRPSFALKLGLIVTFLSVIISGTGLTIFYQQTKHIILEQMGSSLMNTGHVGTFLFGEEERKMIQDLKTAVLAHTFPRTEELLTIAPSEQKESLPPEWSDYYQNTKEFQHLVQILRKIQFSSSPEIKPLQILPQTKSTDRYPPAIYAAYLMVALPESPDHKIVMFLADSNYEILDQNENGTIEDEELGNPIGNLYAPLHSIFGLPFEDGEKRVQDEWYTDVWGTFVSAAIPIKNQQGEVIAVLGLDYIVTSTANRLNNLFYICIAIVSSSFILSLLLAFFIAYRVSIPIKKLREGTENIRQRNFNVAIKIDTHDEFQLLAQTFNSMAVEIRDYAQGLEELVEERTKDLVHEKEVSESLLHNILPVLIANRIRQGETMIADSFPEVTVLFCDIVEFSALTSRVSPTRLVEMLNQIFSEFDRLADYYHLEKIKTIGDAYMAVAGIPQQSLAHAEVTARMALDMIDIVDQLQTTLNEKLNVRIGIHSGKVIAGVIGKRKFTYDLWGDTVNIASRMESHGLAGKIHCSDTFYELLVGKFVFEERGITQIKGKGKMLTYFLVRTAV